MSIWLVEHCAHDRRLTFFIKRKKKFIYLPCAVYLHVMNIFINFHRIKRPMYEYVNYFERVSAGR